MSPNPRWTTKQSYYDQDIPAALPLKEQPNNPITSRTTKQSCHQQES